MWQPPSSVKVCTYFSLNSDALSLSLSLSLSVFVCLTLFKLSNTTGRGEDYTHHFLIFFFHSVKLSGLFSVFYSFPLSDTIVSLPKCTSVSKNCSLHSGVNASLLLLVQLFDSVLRDQFIPNKNLISWNVVDERNEFIHLFFWHSVRSGIEIDW